jgi:hypothetical protein
VFGEGLILYELFAYVKFILKLFFKKNGFKKGIKED